MFLRMEIKDFNKLHEYFTKIYLLNFLMFKNFDPAIIKL